MMDPGNVYEKVLSCHAERRLSVLSAPSFQAPSRRRSASVYSDDVAGMLLDPCYSGVGSGGSTFLALKEPYLAHQQDDTRKLNLPDADISAFFLLFSSSSSSLWTRLLWLHNKHTLYVTISLAHLESWKWYYTASEIWVELPTAILSYLKEI